jgi:hexosaminidase
MYSPLTLFADACSADALMLMNLIAQLVYIENKNLENQKIVTDFFKWITMNGFNSP